MIAVQRNKIKIIYYIAAVHQWTRNRHLDEADKKRRDI